MPAGTANVEVAFTITYAGEACDSALNALRHYCPPLSATEYTVEVSLSNGRHFTASLAGVADDNTGLWLAEWLDESGERQQERTFWPFISIDGIHIY